MIRTVVRSPSGWHYISLAVGLVFILILQVNQWFYFDDWAFIKLNGPGFLSPHVGHWSTSPMLIFAGLRSLVGVHSYYPWVLLGTIAHLALSHILWRVTNRSGANPWIATSAIAILIFFGAGAENILWGFQIGFMGAMALALGAYLLGMRDTLSRGRFVAMIAISVFSLTWSGTALPIIAATTLLLWRSHGWRKALIFVVINAGVYLSWYALFAVGNPNNPDTGGFSAHKLFVLIPLFLGILIIIGWDSILPFAAVVGLFATLIWTIRSMVKRRSLAVVFPALPLGIASIIFAVLTAYSRAAVALGGAASSRYVYALFVLLLPIIAVAITRLTLLPGPRVKAVLIASVLLVALAGYQGVQLVRAAASQSATELRSERLLSAALSLHLTGDPKVRLDATPDSKNAPDIQMVDLIALYDAGDISVGHYTARDLALVTKRVDSDH